MQKLRRALASPRNARDHFAPRARVPCLLAITQRHFTLGLFGLVSPIAPSESGPVRSCSEKSFRNT